MTEDRAPRNVRVSASRRKCLAHLRMHGAMAPPTISSGPSLSKDSWETLVARILPVPRQLRGQHVRVSASSPRRPAEALAMLALGSFVGVRGAVGSGRGERDRRRRGDGLGTLTLLPTRPEPSQTEHSRLL